jgi:hypothetical protein
MKYIADYKNSQSSMDYVQLNKRNTEVYDYNSQRWKTKLRRHVFTQERGKGAPHVPNKMILKTWS